MDLLEDELEQFPITTPEIKTLEQKRTARLESLATAQMVLSGFYGLFSLMKASSRWVYRKNEIAPFEFFQQIPVVLVHFAGMFICCKCKCCCTPKRRPKVHFVLAIIVCVLLVISAFDDLYTVYLAAHSTHNYFYNVYVYPNSEVIPFIFLHLLVVTFAFLIFGLLIWSAIIAGKLSWACCREELRVVEPQVFYVIQQGAAENPQVIMMQPAQVVTQPTSHTTPTTNN